MCGICGVAATDPREVPVADAALRAMTDVIAHRGPDDDGHRLEPGIALGMRRLSVIDIAHSVQPMSNEDGSIWTVFNGEIYNFRDLRRELVRRGHVFRSDGDTETIVHLYEEYGLAFAERLRGMFAIAVWDRERRRLVLVRDRMGVKPLYYAQGPFGLAFASEIKSLIVGGLVQPELDPVGAELFLAWGYVPGPGTLFRGVRKLAPGSMLVWEQGSVREREYWSLAHGGDAQVGQDWREEQERLLQLLRESVRARMISDVPLGVMLSGGIDSSLVATLMAEQSTRPIKTFSVGFEEDARANELGDARRVAQRLGSDHHELLTSALDHDQLLDEALWHLEEPVADLSCLGFLTLSRLARQEVTVALSGQGADELLGGYRKHQVAAAAGALGRVPPARYLVEALAACLPATSSAARGLRALSALDPVRRMLAMSRVIADKQRSQLLEPAFLVADAEDAIEAAARQHVVRAVASPLAQTLDLDTRMALVDNMFLYFDKMSMASSLEVRVPFMDVDVVDFCRQLPDSRKVFRLRRKELLRRASRGLLDDEVIDKKKRGFFHSALGSWLRLHRESLLRETLLDRRTVARGQVRAEAVQALIERSGEGGKKSDQRLYCLFLLERWQRMFVDADGNAARARARLPAQNEQAFARADAA